MNFKEIAKYLDRIEITTGRIEMINILTELYKRMEDADDAAMLSYIILGEIHPPYKGFEIGMSEKLITKAIAFASGYDSNEVEKRLNILGDIGKVAEEFISKKRQKTLFTEELTLRKIYNTFSKITLTTGEGSIDMKIKHLTGLLVNASPLEARYIARLADGNMRLGVADMTILEALANVKGGREYKPILETAYNKHPDIGEIAKVLYSKGWDGIKNIDITPGIPLRPMLAERVRSPEEAWEKLKGKLAAEFKYDGERMQIHILRDNRVMIFSRRLENITHQFPDVIEIVKKHIKLEEGVIEGEAIAFDPDTGEFKPFQELMRRKRKHDVHETAKLIPVTLRLFDLIYDGESYLEKPFPIRRKKLEEVVSENELIKVSELIYPETLEELKKFFFMSVEQGFEGLMIKSTGPDSIYQAGARGWLWIKLKRDYRVELTDTLDLVVVGALYGRGRKAGSLSSYLMAVYDPKDDTYKTVCKVGTGFKDEDIVEMNRLLKPFIRDRKPARVVSHLEPDVWIEPAIVLEITASEITLSPIHTCAYDLIEKNVGLALRFPRFTGRYRLDKSPEDATTEKEVMDMYHKQKKVIMES
ncbi:MAG TPA: ATP-dependent DNA ligase [Thermoprotei archaeon]|nr:ATP-dependent DNA ligase [Thermoprotei archaeon]